MAFTKYANAQVVSPGINFKGWDEVRQRAGAAFNKREATKVVLQKYDPKEFLLSHCTIIASVDAEKGPGSLGSQMVDNFQINRKYADYHVTAPTLKYINNNNDCWERKLLLAAFRTFTGGENYVEHIQIPELSKGKIIDAAARDVGDSIYVDILVATNRKHKPLIEAITAGSLSTLSMGCQVQFTICTKCGNVADDETQLCPHVKYLKGNDFFDEFGQKRKIAELCGHIEDEPGSVKFIEASWVANPAFRGAVLRSILSAEDISNLGGLDGKMSSAFAEPARVAEQGALQKAARMQEISGMPAYVRNVLGQEFGMDDPAKAAPPAPPGAPAPPAAPKKDEDPTKKMVDDLAQSMREKAMKKVQDEMGADEASAVKNLHENQNDNLVKAAMNFPEWRSIAKTVIGSTGNQPRAARKILAGLVLYKSGGWQEIVKTGSFSGRELLSVARMLDLLTLRSITAGESRVYRTVLAVGGMAPYQDIKSYISACRQVVGRDLTSDEQSSLINKGQLFDLGS
jgi:hypothetical protein